MAQDIIVCLGGNEDLCFAVAADKFADISDEVEREREILSEIGAVMQSVANATGGEYDWDNMIGALRAHGYRIPKVIIGPVFSEFEPLEEFKPENWSVCAPQ